MSHVEKNLLITILVLASGYFYVLNYLHADLVEDAVQLCFFDEPEQTVVANL